MIRRDYILRMIEEFVRVLARITSLKKERRWEEAQATVDEELKRLVADLSLDKVMLQDVIQKKF